MDNQRIFLYGALGLVLLFIFQAWQQEHPSAPIAPAPVSNTTPAPTDSGNKSAAIPDAPAASGGAAPSAVAKPDADIGQGERVEIVTDLLRAVIDTDGGDLRQLFLLKHPVASDKPEEPFRLMNDGADAFFAQSGLLGIGGVETPTHRTRFSVDRKRFNLGENDIELRVPLTYQTRSGLRYTKTYIFRRGSYAVDVEFAVVNQSKQPWRGALYAQFQRSFADTSGGLTSVATYTGAAIYTPDGHYEKISFDDIVERKAKTPGNDKVSILRDEVKSAWVAMLQHYFVGAWLPNIAENVQLYSDKAQNGNYVAGYKQLQPTEIAPGQRGILQSRLYAGPKEQSRLKLLTCSDADLAKESCDENPQHAPGMELTVDYGVLTFISAPLFQLMEWIHYVVRNWGWSIVLLTLLVKLAFYPLSAMSYRSMAQMRKVAPKMEAIKKQYASDKQQLNQAMMELYKTEKINPFGGCLPILIQIPVFLALYWVLLESVEMRQAPWVLWIKDLSTKDPYYVLPIIMGATMYLQQMLSPQPPDPVQRKMFQFMPLIFTAMFIFFPAGLVLYWTVNNLLSILQQWRINTLIENKKPKAA